MEHWIEVNLFVEMRDQDHILLDVLLPYVVKLRKKRTLVSFHFFREPEIRFRVRLSSRSKKEAEKKAIAALARSLEKRGLVSKWHFDNHSEKGKPYSGEEDRYGKRGWEAAQDYFRSGSKPRARPAGGRRRSILRQGNRCPS